ncbi:MAG: hypothetical protein IPI30_21235 [Saprospiraceae bacterium]|nr:hypothetical protein [Candidatus Vicinibacter affinis]
MYYFIFIRNNDIHLFLQRYFSKVSIKAKQYCLTLLLFAGSILPVELFAANYYWVGGTGNWNDLTHWATASGGAIKHTIVPSVLDNVIFDINSFTATGQTVTVNQEAYCMDFKWDNVANNPTFNGAGFNLNVSGDFIALGTLILSIMSMAT